MPTTNSMPKPTSASTTSYPLADAPETLRDLLAAWYHLRRRQLPWREDPSPYRVWISEIMLQQTQVATVLPYFERFLAAFPDVESLAQAPEDAVLALWSGLGYYRRARFLHAAAKRVVDDFDGVLPKTPEALRELPGIGRYTSAAIASVAHGFPAAVVDGNVNRVIARLLALDLAVNVRAGEKVIEATADALLDRDDPSSHNQAMMELGALVCSPRNPLCEACPLREDCRARLQGDVHGYPVKKKKAKSKAVHEVAGLWTREDGAILLAQRPRDVLLGGLWELPGATVAAGGSRKTALVHGWQERLGVGASAGTLRGSVTHVFTHRKLTLDIYDVQEPTGTPTPTWYIDLAWRSPQSLGPGSDLPLSTLTRKVLAAVGYGQ